MATENPVFQVLAPTGNQPLIPKDHIVGDLQVGQLGIFNYHTGLSIDGTVLANARDVYFAVGITRSGGATLEDVNKSAGQLIQIRNAKALTVKGYIPPLPNIWEISGFGAKCATNYSVKIEMRSQQSYGINGYNQFANTYNFETGCCSSDCDACPSGDPNELAQGLVDAINNDPDKIQTASLFANKLGATVTAAVTTAGTIALKVGSTTYNIALTTAANSATAVATAVASAVNSTTNSPYIASSAAAVLTFTPKASKSNSTDTVSLTSAGGTGVTMGSYTSGNVNITDMAAFQAAYPGASASIRITANLAADTPFNGSIPVKYYSSRDQKLIVSLVDGFDCNGNVTEIQPSQIEDGYGRELAFLEYEAGGWNGRPGPYRTSSVTGLQNGDYDHFINHTAKYTQVVLAYDQFSVGGWLEYLNNLETIIAIPCADSATLLSLVAITDLIFPQFKPNTTLAGNLTCNGAFNVPTSGLSYANSGIASLA